MARLWCSSGTAACAQVNWPTLWMSWRERELREILVLPLIVGIMLVPIGLFSGALQSFFAQHGFCRPALGAQKEDLSPHYKPSP